MMIALVKITRQANNSTNPEVILISEKTLKRMYDENQS